jgi:hypothetical protein
MAAATITVTVLVVLLIVAIAALLMKINEDTKRMDALRRMKNPPVERPAVMPRRLPRDPRDRRMDGSYAGEPSTSELAAVKAMAAMRKAKAEAAAKAAAEAAVIYTNPSRKVKLSAQEYFAKAQAAEREASGSDFIDNEERMYRPPLQSAQEYFAKAAAEAAARAAAANSSSLKSPKRPQAPVDDIENVGDQSLMLDEDPSQEYDEMAEETGIAKIAIPQPDENWIKSRQVQPVKDLSVGIAITNDVSKQDNLQAGKITSKFPIRARPAVMPPMFPHKGPQGKPAYFEAMRAAAAKAAQERDAKARSMVDKRARSMAENSEMQALKRIDNSGMKQYDMKKGPPARSFGIATPTRPTRLPQKRPCSDFGNGYRDDGMGCWLGDKMVVSLSERTGTTEAAVTAVKMKAKMQAAEAGNKAAMKAAKMEAAEAGNKAAMKAAKMEAAEAGNKAAMQAAKMQAAEAGNKAAMKAAKMQVAEAGNKAAMQAAEAAEYAEHQRKQNAAIEVFRFERREAAMKAAKMQAEEAGNKAAMKAAKMQAAEAANKAAMKAAKMQAAEAANKAVMKAATMQAEEAANKAAMKVEGYEMMEPRGYAIRV